MSEKTDDAETATPAATPPATTPPPAAPATPPPSNDRLTTLIEALPDTLVNALKEGVKALTPPPAPTTPTPPPATPPAESSPGSANERLHPWFRPLGAWGKGKK